MRPTSFENVLGRIFLITHFRLLFDDNATSQKYNFGKHLLEHLAKFRTKKLWLISTICYIISENKEIKSIVLLLRKTLELITLLISSYLYPYRTHTSTFHDNLQNAALKFEVNRYGNTVAFKISQLIITTTTTTLLVIIHRNKGKLNKGDIFVNLYNVKYFKCFCLLISWI